LTTGEEAVTLRRELVDLDRNTHLANLAGSLVNLARWSHEAGRRAAGLRWMREARDLYHELANHDPKRFDESAARMDARVAELAKDA
jgi:hypothetical protein